MATTQVPRIRGFVPIPGDPDGVRQGGGEADTGVVSAATTTPAVVVRAPGSGARTSDTGHSLLRASRPVRASLSAVVGVPALVHHVSFLRRTAVRVEG